MSTKTVLQTFMVVLGALAWSCKDEGETQQPPALNTATITITAPLPAALYHLNDSVLVIGTAIGREQLHGYEVFIRRKSDGFVMYTADRHAHGTTVNVREAWASTVSTLTDMEVEIIVTLDHDGNTTNKKVSFQCGP